jgi:hypothetical protein
MNDKLNVGEERKELVELRKKIKKIEMTVSSGLI